MFRNKTDSLDDVMLVGPSKPISYKTLSDLSTLCKTDPLNLQARLESKGLRPLILTGDACTMRSGALYVWDHTALTALLAANASMLRNAGWPSGAEDFIRRIATDWAPEKTALYDLVADAFGDKTNPGRRDNSTPAGSGCRLPFFKNSPAP